MGLPGKFVRKRSASHLWLELTNINTPAIHTSRRIGFAF